MKAVDLLSQDLKPPSRWPAWGALPLLILILTVGIFASAVLYVQAEGRVAQNDAQLAGLRRQLASVDAPRQQVGAPQGGPGSSGLRSAVIATLAGRASWGGLLRGVGRAMPAGAWLTKLSVTQPGVNIEGAAGSPSQAGAPIPESPVAGGARTGMALSLIGCALGQGLIGRAVNGVNRLPGASGVSVSSRPAGNAQGSDCGSYPSFQLSLSFSGGRS